MAETISLLYAFCVSFSAFSVGEISHAASLPRVFDFVFIYMFAWFLVLMLSSLFE